MCLLSLAAILCEGVFLVEVSNLACLVSRQPASFRDAFLWSLLFAGCLRLPCFVKVGFKLSRDFEFVRFYAYFKILRFLRLQDLNISIFEGFQTVRF